MFSFCKRKDVSADADTAKLTTEVGWVVDTSKAGFIWEAPRRLTRLSGRTTHAKGVSVCPAANDHDARIWEVPCPIDLHIRFVMKDGEPGIATIEGDQASIRSKHLNQMCTIVSRKEWRHPDRPIIQFFTPYVFLSDAPVYITQQPPYYHYPSQPWPGILIGGRFPIDVWPRGLVWAFEWFDTSKPIHIKRGEPWFYVVFETDNPARRVRLIEAEMTPELREYSNGLAGVTNYVSQTYDLFETARSRRPSTLLVPKVRS